MQTNGPCIMMLDIGIEKGQREMAHFLLELWFDCGAMLHGRTLGPNFCSNCIVMPYLPSNGLHSLTQMSFHLFIFRIRAKILAGS